MSIKCCTIVLHPMCRICWKTSDEMINIFESRIEGFLNQCCDVKADVNDKLPREICMSCYQSLKSAWMLKLKCEDSYKIWSSALEKHSNAAHFRTKSVRNCCCREKVISRKTASKVYSAHKRSIACKSLRISMKSHQVSKNHRKVPVCGFGIRNGRLCENVRRIDDKMKILKISDGKRSILEEKYILFRKNTQISRRETIKPIVKQEAPHDIEREEHVQKCFLCSKWYRSVGELKSHILINHFL